jgi:hypothetical protein
MRGMAGFAENLATCFPHGSNGRPIAEPPESRKRTAMPQAKPDKSRPDNAKPDKRAERQERLAAELRANLKKRKAQGRSRRERADSDPDATPGPGALADKEPLG